MAPISEFMIKPMFALESHTGKWPVYKKIFLYMAFSHGMRPMAEGEVAASVMGLLALRFPFTVSQGDKANQLYLKW